MLNGRRDIVPRISVVVPTCRRPALIERCLQALLEQTIERSAYEVIVVDDGRTEETRQAVDSVVRRHARGVAVRYLRPPEGSRGPAGARNSGWRVARAPIVAFTDDDTVPDADWLRAGERGFKLGVMAVAGRVEVPAAVDPASGARLRPTDHELMTIGLAHAEFVTANAFVRRRALRRVGGFDERFRRPWREDSDLQFSILQAGGKVVRCGDAVVLHPVRDERWGVSLRQQQNVFYDALLFKKHPQLYRERILPVPPWDYYGIVALALCSVLLAVLRQPALALATASLACAGVASFAWRRLRSTSRSTPHVVEMLATSALIPFLSVYWRLRGAWHFRVLYL